MVAERGEAGSRDLTIPAADGYPLAATLFLNGRQWLIINSATGVKRGFYSKFASYLAEQGYSVVTYDYRGIGGSAPPSLRGSSARMSEWGELDFAGVMDWVERRKPSHMLGLGHSVGGQILGMLPRAGRLHCFIGVACQSGWWGHWPLPWRYLLPLGWKVALPLLVRTFGFLPSSLLGLGEDLPPGVARQWANWCLHRHYYHGSIAELPGFRDFAGPLLAYSFSDDRFGPRPAVEAWLRWFAQAETQHRHIRPGDLGLKRLGHFEFFRQDSVDIFWEPCRRWLAERCGRPSE
ncbi:MAG TPA: alpha/beta fold hydrolase [Acidobacteriota bacterium]|nr:alpha/beta fold hydrolase [Acidobacteriota bacterium]